MQYIQFHPQIVDELKMNEAKSLFQLIEGSIIKKFEDMDLFKELILLYDHKKKELVQQLVHFGLNSIFVENKYILLCKCYYEMRYTKLKQNEGFYIIILHNSKGKEYLIMSNSNQFSKIQGVIKRFCISKNFFNKYQLIQQRSCLPIVQNCKNQELYCVLQIDKRQIVSEQDQEQFYNSIVIMNYMNEQTKLVKIYEENQMYFLFMKYKKLQSLEQLILNDFEFREAPLVCIIYLILQTLQKYKNLGIYHGNISLKTIYINMSGAFLQIIILFPKYLMDTTNNNKSSSLDILNLGQLLYQITFYEKKDKIKQFVDQKLISQQKSLFQSMNIDNNQFKFLYRISQLDLLNQLLTQTITIENALKHQWFVTVKQNLKAEFMKENKEHLNLNTIIESNNEISMTISIDKRISTKEFAECEIEDEFPVKCSILNPFQMNPSKQKHDNCILKSKSFSNFDLNFENQEKYFANEQSLFIQ